MQTKRFHKNPRGQKLPVYTREDLVAMQVSRRDATLHEVWPSSGKPHPQAFYFDMGSELRPSVLVKEAK